MKQELHDIIIIGAGCRFDSRPLCQAGGDGGGFIGTLPARRQMLLYRKDR